MMDDSENCPGCKTKTRPLEPAITGFSAMAGKTFICSKCGTRWNYPDSSSNVRYIYIPPRDNTGYTFTR